MQRISVVAYVLVLVSTLLLGVGCKDQVPLSDLDRFVARTSHLEGEALDDTLRHFASLDPPYSGYANYLIGNLFYLDAGDSARAHGWAVAGVQTMLDSAAIYFERAVAEDSTFIEALVNLGSLWDDRSQEMTSRVIKNERVAKVEAYYRQALRVDPLDEKARCNLGALFLRQRRPTEAIAEFNKVLENDPQSPLAHYNMAIMFAEAKIYREAIAEFELAAKYDPDGDIGDRSRDNVDIVKDLMNAPTPPGVE